MGAHEKHDSGDGQIIGTHVYVNGYVTYRDRVFALMADKVTELYMKRETNVVRIMNEVGEQQELCLDYMLVGGHKA